MKNNLLIIGGVGIALYIVAQRKKNFMDSDNEDFREGYTAGFFTPGPFAIAALLGLTML